MDEQKNRANGDSLTVLLQVKAVEDRGEQTRLLDVYKLRQIRLEIAELLHQGAALAASGDPDQDFALPLLDPCPVCQQPLTLLLDEHRTSVDGEMVFCLGNIYCQQCSPSQASPTFVISTVYDPEGGAIECECLLCEDCDNNAVIWLEGTVLCWPCIEKHKWKREIAESFE